MEVKRTNIDSIESGDTNNDVATEKTNMAELGKHKYIQQVPEGTTMHPRVCFTTFVHFFYFRKDGLPTDRRT